MLLKFNLLIIIGFCFQINCQKIYCQDELKGMKNIPSDDNDLIKCKNKQTLTECLNCLDNTFLNKGLVRRCRDEILDDRYCEQIVPELDNCHNRCPEGCFCKNGSCREHAPGSIDDTWPCKNTLTVK